MLTVRNDESLASDSQSCFQEDEMLLTHTDPALSFHLGTNVSSTQRSNQPVVVQAPGEFEKRITDIKAKLNQIKNSINTEIDKQPSLQILQSYDQPAKFDYYKQMIPSPAKRPIVFKYDLPSQ